MKSSRLHLLMKTFGPGILFASTAIGVSHLVQSTRAGAMYGFGLVGFIILANVTKYPAFEFGSRYANVTGESIIAGYRRMGKSMLSLYLAVTLGTMFFVCAAVGLVTSGFLNTLFGNVRNESTLGSTLILFCICIFTLAIGKYRFLDGFIKIIATALLVSTILAVVLVLMHGPAPHVPGFKPPSVWKSFSSSGSGTLFVIALMGWMPTGVDLSAWNSLWTLARIRQTGYKPSLADTLLDFNLGYVITGILAICFLTLGAFLLYGTGQTLPEGSVDFASQIVSLYTTNIGDWSFFIIATAAFCIMFGTCIAVFDGYSRALGHAILQWREAGKHDEEYDRNIYLIVLFVLGAGAFGIIWYFQVRPNGFKALIDLATSLSFLIAPLIAIANHRLVHRAEVPVEYHPPAWLRYTSYFGIVFLSLFSLYYIYFLLVS